MSLSRLDAGGGEQFLAYYDELLGFVKHRVGCPQTAADVVQDAYLRLLNRGQAQVEQPRAFFYRVVGSVMIDHWRREQCRRQHAATAQQELAPQAQAEPQERLEHQEGIALMRQALDTLSVKCREVFILHRFSGLSYPQIAERVGISVSTVEKHMIKALAACRAHLEAHRRC
jgi:RNA polymerase sigma-70 factor (ECF subfamily)